MARRRAREFALKALYQADVAGGGPVAALEGLFAGQLDSAGDDKPAGDEEARFAQRVVSCVAERGEEIDELIEKASKNWRLARMPVVDRSILRLATGEMLLLNDVPVSVSITISFGIGCMLKRQSANSSYSEGSFNAISCSPR